MTHKNASVFDMLVELPWWVSTITAGVVYVGIRYVFPAMAADSALAMWAGVAPRLAWVAVLFLIPAPVSALRSLQKRQLLDRHRDIASVQALSWKEFEMLLGEAFRRQGYAVRENAYAGPDGGIDLTIARDGNAYLVQCKHWRAQKVGVRVVREMLGLVTAHAAQGAVIVTSGTFTQEAKSFAAGRPIGLIEGTQLVEMVRSVQAGQPAGMAPATPQPQDALRSATSTVDPAATSVTRRICPACGGNLVVRVARRGANAGSQFWGCANFPQCRHTEPFGG